MVPFTLFQKNLLSELTHVECHPQVRANSGECPRPIVPPNLGRPCVGVLCYCCCRFSTERISDATAQVHHASWRCGSGVRHGMAARDSRTACTGQAPYSLPGKPP